METQNVELINQWLWFTVHLAHMVAWPLVVALVVWWVRAGILKLLNSLAERTLIVKAPGGFEASIGAVTAQDLGAGMTITEARISPTPLAGPSARPAVAQLEGELRHQLVGVEPTQQNALLLRELAETRVRVGHESIYNRIFGSQIVAIRELDTRGSATMADAKQYYDSLIPRFPTVYPAYPFDGWLDFMISVGLMSRDGELLRPTVYGHDFVVYLTENRLSGDKPF